MHRLAAPLGIALFLVGCATAPPPANPGDELIDAMVAEEAAFMDDTRTLGLMPAFSQRAADEAVMLLPGPTRIKPRLATEKWPGELSWSPAFATASGDGTLGASTGPSSWVVRGKASPGYYFTVWKRQSDGTLRFVFDGSADMPRDLYASRPGVPERVLPSRRELRPSAAEDSLTTAIAAGNAQGYASAIHPRGRVLRDGHEPAVGPDAAAKLLKISAGERQRVIETHAASSGDFVWTYGNIDNGDAKTVGHFVRVWVLGEEGWRIAIDFRKDL